MRRHWPAVETGLEVLYPGRGAQVAAQLALTVAQHVANRDESHFQRDLQREAESDWYQQPDMVGYVAYADRFAGNLAGIHDHLDYLGELGITYLHLMPLLKAREGESDGGYAVASYEEVDPRLGTTEDLRTLSDALHARGMSLCIDLVVNHTAAEHDWALRARAGEKKYRDYYFMYPDREMPDRYERTLREVFPTFAPGNFTWLEDAQQWVWTTFNTFQWDLNWQNPDVFCEFVGIMMRLSDLGVDLLRLDAVPFMWKREGTDCENQPEVHTLLCTLRAVMATASPALIFKAEAIVPPDQLTPYVGAGDPPRRECEIAYHNQLMVLLWSSLATGEARLLTNSLQRVGDIPLHATWVTYVRCHDDIGWAITDDAAGSLGWNGFDHRNFLNSFFSGQFEGSFARGEIFQFNPETGDGRISGSAASLCGIEAALAAEDDAALDAAVRRLELVYAVIASFGGIPLVYMGDEIGLLNDHSYLDDPDLRDDNRWVHRPHMDWEAAALRSTKGTLQNRLFGMFSSLMADRARTVQLHGAVNPRALTLANNEIYALVRRHPVRGSFAMVGNFGRGRNSVNLDDLGLGGVRTVRSAGATVSGGSVTLDSMGYAWFTAS